MLSKWTLKDDKGDEKEDEKIGLVSASITTLLLKCQHPAATVASPPG